MARSMIDVAYELLSKKKKPTPFLKIWSDVSSIEGLTPAQQEDRIAQFFSDLCLDSRFVNMGENKWDLRNRHTLSEVLVNTDELLVDDSDEEDELENVQPEEEVEEKEEEKY